MKQYTLVNRLLAGVAFLITLVTYVATLQPSVPFWDCGEFTAAATWQQVPHPPGAPLWLIVARFFQIFVPGEAGWAINFFSAVCSAVTAALLYLIIVMLMERWHPYREGKPISSYLTTFGAGIIGTLAFTWSDTQWFNSVESEVYAGAATLIALLMYLMLRWDQEAERPGHERYLLLMAYVVGLAFGVHLLALLMVPGIAMVVYFRAYRFTPLSFCAMLGISGIAFYVFAYKAPLEYMPKMLAGQDIGIGGGASQVLGFIILLALAGLIWWARTNRKAVLFLSASSFALILLGFTSYTQILVRAEAHPPMNENEPDTMTELVDYLGRKQYGKAPNWPRRYKIEPLHRQYQDKYGEWSMPVGQDEDGYIYDSRQINSAGEMNFMFRYQIWHMYVRYFLWNFVGRVSDVQDANWTFMRVTDGNPVPGPEAPESKIKREFISETGYADLFPIQFYALPLLLGLFGIYYHYRRDWKMALVSTVLFLLLGVLATLQQNQQQPQPRERDYFYVGSYMVFTLWIGLGAAGIVERLRGKKKQENDETIEEGRIEDRYDGISPGLAGGALAACLVLVPLNMAFNGWQAHDRSGNWVPWDYAYNILQSCEKDAILFTNGDNDTFPLWYIQDVDGVRRDVRIVNLSLGNTLWYVWQLKNERPWGAQKVKLSFPDNILVDGAQGSLSYTREAPRPVSIEVPAGVMSWATGGANGNAGSMSWTLTGERLGQGDDYLLRVQDKLVEDILRQNKWERPVYFSSSVQPQEWTGLDEYLRTDGLVYRIMPVKQGTVRSMEAMNYEVTKKCLMETLPDDKYHTEPHYGFKFRNLANRDVFLLEDHRRQVVGSIMPAYRALAIYEILKNQDKKAALAVLNKMEEQVPSDKFSLPYYNLAELATIYEQAGDTSSARKFAARAIAAVDALGNWAEEDDPAYRYYPPITVKTQMYEVTGEFDKAIEVYKELYAQAMRQKDPSAPQIRSHVDELVIRQLLDRRDTAGAVTKLRKLVEGYRAETDPELLKNMAALESWLAELTGTAVAQPDHTAVDTTKTTVR